MNTGKDKEGKIMKTTATYNPHGWFFRHVSMMEDYNKGFEKVIREGIVFEYSGGKTDSLKKMYANHRYLYDRMRRELTGGYKSELDMARKRVIAVLFSYLHFLGYRANMNYVKEVARKACKADSFNGIPLKKLKQLYRIFGAKYKKKSDEWSDRILTKIAGEAWQSLN